MALVLWGYDGVRYSITEACITQVRQSFGALLDARVDAPPAQVGEGYASPLDAHARERVSRD
ncbi:MAG: hypothetical protein V4550_04755 [Gemmatimonadota bacterium]